MEHDLPDFIHFEAVLACSCSTFLHTMRPSGSMGASLASCYATFALNNIGDDKQLLLAEQGFMDFLLPTHLQVQHAALTLLV